MNSHSASGNRGRRRFLQSAAFGTVLLTTPGLFAEELMRTAGMTEGPFYPDKLPLDTDNDLLLINDALNPAVGEVTHLTGRVLTNSGAPVRNAEVEIWQVDSQGSYLHSRGAGGDGRDSHFQGFGRFLTDSQGRYYFRTVKPVPYQVGSVFRAPHIHFAIDRNGRRLFTTQMLVAGHEANARDGLLQRIPTPEARKTVLADFKPIKESRIGELAVNFDIVLGLTVEELGDGSLRIGR